MPSQNGTWIGTYKSVMTRLVGMAPLGTSVVGDEIVELDANSVGSGQWQALLANINYKYL